MKCNFIVIKNKNENRNLINEMKKSKTFNIDENINCNLQYNNGQNYLETVKETLNEVSNSKIDISGLNEEKNNNNINYNENKIKIENKSNEVELKENNKVRIQESDNNGSSYQATLSGLANTKKNMFIFK